MTRGSRAGTPRAPRLGLAAAGACALLAVALARCASGPAPRGETLAAGAAEVLGARLADAVRRAHEAVDGVGEALVGAGPDEARRFAALEALRARTGVDGLSWDPPEGASAWAGDPLEPRGLPAPPPWEASFRRGDTTWYAGPFVRGLLVERSSADGTAVATVHVQPVEDARLPGTLESRWAQSHRVRSVRVLPGDGPEPVEPGARRVVVRDPHGDREPLLAVEAAPLDEAAVADLRRAEERARAGVGFLGLLALAAVVGVAASRRLPPLPRGLALAVAALAVRAALRALDLPERFPSLAPAFQAADFGIAGYAGWLSSPADLFLTGVAALACATALARLPSRAPGARRRPFLAGALAVAGVLGAVAASVAWLFLVRVAAVHTQLDYFRPGRLLPSLPRGLVLSGLVAATAAAWLVAATGLRVGAGASPARRDGRLPALALAAAALSLAVAPPGFPAWAPLLVPLAGGLVPWLAPRDVRAGRPSRILLTSVLATGLLFPALWVRVTEAARDTVLSDVRHLVGREEVVAADLLVDLASLADDPHLVGALSRLEQGEPPPEGLALHAWQRLGLGARPEGASVRVVDAHYGTVDRFWLDTPPASRLPRSLPLEPGEEVVVEAGIESPGKVRSVVGDVRVGGAGEARPVGRVVVVVPDLLSAELLGLAPARLPRDPEEGEGARGERLALTLVRDGAVVASNEPALPRSSFPDLPDLSGVEEPRWIEGPAHERLAFPLPDGRGVLLASRPRGSEHVFLSLARASIVGVGLGAALALLAFAVGARGFRPGLGHRILLSYFAVSVVPLVLLGAASLRSTSARHERVFRERHSLLVSAAREDLAALGASLFDFASEDVRLEGYAGQRGIDLTVYRKGGVVGSSVSPLLAADLLPVRLPAEAYRATELEGRDALGRDETFAGRPVRVGYAPLRDERGRPVATVSVPLLHDTAPADLEAAATGSVLLAAYLLTLVLVVVVGIYLSRGIARPVDLLAEGTKRVAAGEEDVVLPEAGGAEMSALVAAFNRMTRDLKEVRARAAKAERDAAWKGMARQVAHEIKNPLTPMQLMLQHLLAATREDPERGAALVEPTTRIALEQIEALRRIAGDFGSFAGGPRRALDDVDVNHLLASVGALYAAGSPPGVTIETALAPTLPPVRADEDDLRRVLLNLVGNAVESLDGTAGAAGPDGGPRGKVTLRSERAPGGGGRDGVRVTVEDTGVGIPPENRARLFEPAFSTKSSGTGLGLAIVRRVVTDLSGTIDLESEVGRGTRVTVWLPASSGSARPA